MAKSLVDCGLLTKTETKITKQAEISSVVRVVNHIACPMYARQIVMASFLSLADPSSPNF